MSDFDLIETAALFCLFGALCFVAGAFVGVSQFVRSYERHGKMGLP